VGSPTDLGGIAERGLLFAQSGAKIRLAARSWIALGLNVPLPLLGLADKVIE
jgi:hypothetical protein